MRAAKAPKGTVRDPRTGLFLCNFTFAGKRYRDATGTRDPKAAAEYVAKLRARLYDEARLGHEPEAAPVPTLDEVLSAYCRAKLAKGHKVVAKHTIAAQVSVVGRLLAIIGGETPIDDALVKFTTWRDGMVGTLAPRTLNNYAITIKAAAAHAGFIAEAKAVVKAGEDELDNRCRYLSDAEYRRLFEALVAEPVLRDFVVFLLDTGARRREALRIKWTDVDLAREVNGSPSPVLFLENSKTRKAGVRRRLPVTERLLPILRRMKARGEGFGPYVWPWNESDLSIREGYAIDDGNNRGRITPDGERPLGVSAAAPWTACIKVDGCKHHLGTFATEADAIDARRCAEREHFATARPEVSGLESSWDRVIAAANLVDFHMHDFRHDYATRLVRAGVDRGRVAKLLGHKDTKMVDKVYGHLHDDDLDMAAGVLDRIAAKAAPMPFAQARDDALPIVIADKDTAA